MRRSTTGRAGHPVRTGLVGALILIALGSTARGASYTVTGTLKTPTGANALANDVAVRHVRVIVVDEDTLIDDEYPGETANDGSFSVTFSDIVEAPDIFLNVPYIGIAVDGRVVEVRLANTDSDPIQDTNLEGVIHNDIPPGTLALGLLRVTDLRMNIANQIGDAARFLDGQYPAWSMPGDVNAEGRTTNGASFVAADGSYMSISFEDYDHPGAGNAAFSDMHHEFFHWVAYRAYGNRWPNFNCACNPHSSNKECCEGFAMQEGSAQYFGSASAVADNKTGAPTGTDWRGVDNIGSNNSGEIVEGALELIWRLNADLPGNLQVLLTDAPDSMKEFKDGYAADKGTTSAAVVSFLTNCAANGVVYTRGKVTAFTPGDPPNVAPATPKTGNFKLLDSIAFIRGEIIPTISELTLAEIPLAANSATVAADQKDIGFKAAMVGLTEASTGGFTFAGAVAIGSDLKWDTTTQTDGDFDLIVRLRSTHTWLDDFKPDFTGDSHASINSNEMRLKSLRTWWNQDATPSSDDEGKVILDNSAPTVDPASFKPQ